MTDNPADLSTGPEGQRTRPRRWIKWVVALACLAGVVYCLIPDRPGYPISAGERSSLSHLSWFISDTADMYLDGERSLPKGGIDELEQWLSPYVMKRVEEWAGEKWSELSDFDQKYYLQRGTGCLKPAEGGGYQAVDYWGRRLVYRYPSDDERYVFRLYSVGKNGKDENGTGDDVDGSYRR